MNIAVLSGKGGTGKTTVSTNLAIALNANYVDGDVEEPNGFIFLKPDVEKTNKVMIEYPEIDEDKCTSCGACVNACQFNALAMVNGNVILFDKLCHGCGACQIACDYGAITYKKREIGKIESGKYKDITCSRGLLNIGEPMAVPVINDLLKSISNQDLNVIDCPPGTSCNVVNSLKYADTAIVVTEPTEFGLHDLKRAVELVKKYNIPFGIIINKDDGEENIIRKYCQAEGIQLIGGILFNKEVAIIYSEGEILYNIPQYKEEFTKLSERVKEVLMWN